MREEVFRLNPTSAHVDRYQELLRNDWTLQTLERAIELLIDFLSNSGVRLVLAEDVIDDVTDDAIDDSEPKTMLVPSTGSEAFHDYIENLNYSISAQREKLKSFKESLKKTAYSMEEKRLSLLATNAVALLQCPVNFVNTKDPDTRLVLINVAFFNDVRSIVFQCAVLELLPELFEHNLAWFKDRLVNMLFFHAMLFWQDHPAHQHWLRYLVYDAIGDPQHAGESLFYSFKNTSPDEHDYITRGYTYWSHLMENDQPAEAAEFALTLYRKCARTDLPEVRGMIEQAYKLSLCPSPKKDQLKAD
jgi:hypothetical protein